LTLDASLAALAVIGLRPIVFGHDFDKLARQRRVLRLAYPQVRRRFVRLLLMFNVLLNHYNPMNQSMNQCKFDLTYRLRQQWITFEFRSHFVGRLLNVGHQILELLLHLYTRRQSKDKVNH